MPTVERQLSEHGVFHGNDSVYLIFQWPHIHTL